MSEQAPSIQQILGRMRVSMGEVPPAMEKAARADARLVAEQARSSAFAMPPEDGALDSETRTLIYLAVAASRRSTRSFRSGTPNARPVHRQRVLAYRLGAEHRGEDRRGHPVPGYRRPGPQGRHRLRDGDARRDATETSRCVFVIDPGGILRAMIYYPLTTGRNTGEILRLVDALQAADAHQVATPANWRPGEAVIVPTPVTTEQAAERVAGMVTDGYECVDWYLCTKKV